MGQEVAYMQRRVSYWVIIAACLLVGGLFVAATGARAQMPGDDAGTGMGSYMRKLPAEVGSGQPMPVEPGYRPLACTNSVVNVSQTSGNEDESFVVVNPTN